MDSDDYTSDAGAVKRKGVEELFGRSTRVKRTPTKPKTEEKLDLIIEMMTDMKEEFKQMKIKQRECHEELKKVRDENKIIHEENAKLKKENKEIKENARKIDERLEKMERQMRKNNVVMTGLRIDTEDKIMLKQAVEKIMEENMGMRIQVKSASKLGERTCLIELREEKDKEEVMKNKSKLKNIIGEKIYINNDETRMEREKNICIRTRAKEEQKKGNNVKIGYNKININGQTWRWNGAQGDLELQKTKN